MVMLHTTFRKARKAGACLYEYNKMTKTLGGVKKYGEDTPIPLDKILDVCGLDAALWCLRCTIELTDREIRLLACDITDAAWDAAYAAWAAAWNEAVKDIAAWNAARVARDGERQWQEQKLREMLNNSGI